jgi:hypothetical protein
MSQVNTELARYAYQNISLNDSAVRSLAGRPSGSISMSDLRGKSRGFNLYYYYGYYPGERGTNGYTYSRTNDFPGMTINGYNVVFIDSQYTINSGITNSTLCLYGYSPRYLWNNLYGYDGRSYTPSGVSGGYFSYFQYYAGNTYYFWYTFAPNGGLLYAPGYSNGSGYQLFTYN